MLLKWGPCAGFAEAAAVAQEAHLGTAGDGVSFCLTYHPTCYRRGPWRLLVEVNNGEHHHAWGCFDEADQPMRWYHAEATAKFEAESIAAMLLADRIKAGPLEAPEIKS